VSRIVITEGAAIGMEQCRKFLAEKSPAAAIKAAHAIDAKLSMLEMLPAMGRPFADTVDLRELLIKFGDSGYVALYRYQPEDDTVYVVAFKHQRQARYPSSSDGAA